MAGVCRSTITAEFLDAFGGRDIFPPIELEEGADLGWGGSLVVADGTTEQALAFPGITTLSCFGITATEDLEVFLGDPATNAAKTIGAGGVLFAAKLSLTVADGVHVSYNPGDASSCTIRYFAAGA